jgi:hypothetical protein
VSHAALLTNLFDGFMAATAVRATSLEWGGWELDPVTAHTVLTML